MSNILIVPDSGSIYFTTGSAGNSAIPNLSSGVAFKFDNSAGVNITSYATGVSDNDRFSIDGYNGRLFNVSDNLTGIIFSVNDGAGLPIIEVDSGAVDKVTMGTYGTNTFVIDGNKVGIGTGVPAAKLDIFDNVLAGSAGLAGSALNISQTWNTTGTPTAVKINVNDIASGPTSSSRLFDVVYNGTSYLNIIKDGQSRFAGLISANGLVNNSATYLRMQFPVITFGNADQTSLRLEDTHVFALRGTVNAQTLRIYNTYTNPINFERLNLKWDTNVFKIGTEKGTEGGVARDLVLETDATERARVLSTGNIQVKDSLELNTLAPLIGSVKPVLTIYRSGSGGDGCSILCKRDGGQEIGDLRFSGTAAAPDFGINLRHNYTAQSNLATFTQTTSGRGSILFGTFNGLNSATLSIFNSNPAQNMAGILLGNNSTSANSNIDIIFQSYTADPHAIIRGVYPGGTKFGELSFLTANGLAPVEALRITKLGNVGIGTSVPTSNFQVNQPTTGTGTISVDAGGTTVTGLNTQFLNTFKAGDTIGSAGQTLTISSIASNTSMTTSAAGAAISGAGYTLVGGSRFSVAGNGDISFGGTSLIQKVFDIDGVNATKVYFSGNFAFGGNGLAIRYSQINSSSRLVNASSNTSGATAAYLFGLDGTQQNKGLIYDRNEASISLVCGGGSNSDSYSRRLTILENGNVGIGTTTPTQKLEISGGNILSSGTVTGTSGLRLGVSTSIQTANGGAITWGSMNSSGGNTLTFSDFTDSIFFNSQVSMGSNRFNLAGGYIQSITTGGPNNVPTMLFSASQGSDAGNPIFRFTSGSNYTEHRLFGVGSGVTYTEHLTVISNGKVGIGTTTPAARLDIVDSTLAGSGSLAGSVLNIAQTWNTTGAPTAIKLNVTNTASDAASNLLDLQIDGISRLKITKNGVIDFGSSNTASQRSVINSSSGQLVIFSRGDVPTNAYAGAGYWTGFPAPQLAGFFLGSSGGLQWSAGSFADGGSYDLRLDRDASNTLAQKNGVNPQTFRLYNTYTDSTTFERLDIKWDANVLKIGTEKGSVGGTARNLEMDFPILFLSRPLSLADTRTVHLSFNSGGNYIGSFFQVTNFTNLIKLNANTTDGQNIFFAFGNSDLGSKIGNNGVDHKQLIFNNLNTTSGSMRWIMGSTEAIRLTQEGNLGIGTTSPTQKLVVNGSFSVYPNSFNSESRLITRSIHSDGRWALDIRANAGSGDVQALAIYQSFLGLGSGEFQLGAISSAIGISSNIAHIPKLRIAGSGTGPNNASGLVIGSSSYTEWISGANYPDGSNYYEIRTELSAPAQLGGMVVVPTRAPLNIGAKYLSFLTGDTTGVEAMRIASVGNVGIGTTTPTEKLHVLGNIRNVGNLSIYNSDIVTTLDRLTVDGSQGRLFTVTDSLVGSLMSVNDIAGLPILEVFDDDKIVMGEYASNALTVLGKNVGIGTGSPTAKLDILDTVLAGSGSLAGSALNIAQTWNTSGTPTAIKLNIIDTASNAVSNLIDLQVGAVSMFKVNKNGNVSLNALDKPVGSLLINSTSVGGATIYGNTRIQAGSLNFNANLYLHSDDANIFAQRNGVNPQAFRLYNTYTSSTNFERLNLRWDTNVVKIGTEKGSAGGVARDLVFETDGTERARITAAGLFSANGVPFGKGGGNVDTNIAIGLGSLASNINGFNGAGQNNTAIGYNALLDNTDGYDNVAIGSLSLSNNTTGRETIAIGKNSLINSVNGINNIGIGLNSLQYSVSTQSNIGLGNNALDRNTNGNANIAIGHSAGSQAAGFFQYITAVKESIFLGTATKAYSTTGNTNLIVIGYQAQALLSNSVVLGNNNVTDTYLKGAAQIHRLNADPVNYERIAMRWNGTTGTLGTSQLGTGIARDLAFETSGTPRMTIAASGDISFSNPTQVRTALGFVQLTPAQYAALVDAGTTNPDTIYIVQE